MRAWFSKISRRTKILVGVVAAFTVVIAMFLLRGRDSGAAGFQTEAIGRGPLIATVGATGTVRAQESAALTWKTSGTVAKLGAEVGDLVAEGAILAELAKSSLPQSVILAEAELAEAQRALDDLLNSDRARAEALIALKDAETAYERAYNYRVELNSQGWFRKVVIRVVNHQQVPEIKWYRGYADPGTIASADDDLALKKALLEDAQRAHERLENGPHPADVAAAEARVAAAQATLDMGRIIAPFSGTITQALLNAGDQVAAGTTAFRIDDLSRLLIDIEVSEIDINGIKLDQQAALSFDAILGHEYVGRVAEVGLAGDTLEGVVSFPVTIEMAGADTLVKPGMTAAVNIVVTELTDVLRVPNRAVRLVNGQRVVFVLQDGRPTPIQIELGQSSDEMSEVAGGDLRAGDLVILNPPTQMFGPFGG